MIKSVSENLEGFTKREIEAAKWAKKLFQSLGCPSIAMLKNLIWMNAIKNCSISTEDISIAEKIYGPDPNTLKGKIPGLSHQQLSMMRLSYLMNCLAVMI